MEKSFLTSLFLIGLFSLFSTAISTDMTVLVLATPTATATPVPYNPGAGIYIPAGYNGTVYQDHQVVYSPPVAALAASPTPVPQMMPTITIGGKEVGIPIYVYVGALLLAFGGIYWLLAGSYDDLRRALRASARKL